MKAKKTFFCTECGNETAVWSGQCPSCGSWNTLTEAPSGGVSSKKVLNRYEIPKAIALNELESEDETRFLTGFGELDRVLGGGAVKGSIVLVGGEPGIGKSTLLLQICQEIGKQRKTLYVTGEESKRQIKMRADRLNVNAENVYILAETNLDLILDAVDKQNPEVLIIDSIQTLYKEDTQSTPGSVSQVRECTLSLMQLAKTKEITIFIIGHINKDGAIAGPKILEHMVDCVLYFEGSDNSETRLLRAAKNRYGSTNELGVFEMKDSGLKEVKNPSELLLSERPKDAPGTCVVCVIEGQRPILAEIQALVAKSSFNIPRRTSNGIEYNRAMLLLTILEKRAGFKVGICDAYINVIGGLEISEPAADLATVLAIASSYIDKVIDPKLVAIGELGLTGEIRAVSMIEQRIAEIYKMGFRKCILPKSCARNLKHPDDLELIPVDNILQAVRAALGK